MQTIMINEQDVEQIRPVMSVNEHVGNLFVGLLVGLMLMLFDRGQRTASMSVAQPKPAARRGRRLLFLLGTGLLLFLLVLWIQGP